VLIAPFRDRFTPDKKSFSLQNWSLRPAIASVGIFITSFIVQSLWSLLPILKNYQYNPFNWEVFSLIYAIFILIGIYICLTLIYSVRVVDAFDLRLPHSFILLKICGILAGLNILGMYILRVNFFAGAGGVNWEAFDSPGLKYFLIYSLNTVIVDPILEESVFSFGYSFTSVPKVMVIGTNFAYLNPITFERTATDFKLKLFNAHPSSTASGTYNFDWIAIGE
jgi:hypothetical protein